MPSSPLFPKSSKMICGRELETREAFAGAAAGAGEAAVASAVAFGSGWAWPGLFNLAIVRLNPAAPAAATGITQTGVYVGALSGPIAFGVIVDQVGYGWAWTVAAICSVGAAAGVRHGRNRILAWRAGHVVAATD